MSKITKLSTALIFISLSGCVGGLLGGGKPADVYSFRSDSEQRQPDQDARIVAVRQVSFAGNLRPDSIETNSDLRVAALAKARWAQPVPEMFRLALIDQLEARSSRTRVARSDFQKPADILSAEISQFTARFDQGPKAPPLVMIVVRSELARGPGRDVSVRTFEARVRASDATVTSIVEAYRLGVANITTDIALWYGNA
jgi:cholesterol transport system auxiliary component